MNDPLFPESSWLRELWEEAYSRREESLWHALPAKTMDAIDYDTKTITQEDLAFLSSIACSKEEPPLAVVAAIRILACLAEDDLEIRNRFTPLFYFLLEAEDNAYLRYAAIEAIWQAEGANADVNSLIKALNKETHPQIIDTIKHVIGLCPVDQCC